MTVSPEMQARWAAFDRALREDCNVIIDLAKVASEEVERAGRPRVLTRGEQAAVLARLGTPPPHAHGTPLSDDAVRWAQEAFDKGVGVAPTARALKASTTALETLMRKGRLRLPGGARGAQER